MMDPIVEAFNHEAEELIAALEAGLMRLEEDPADEETIHAVFRAVHTLKGASATVGCASMAGFTHVLENTLEAVRSHQREMDAALIESLLASVDYLRQLLQFCALNGMDESGLDADGQALSSALMASDAPQSTAATPVRDRHHWHISLRFPRDLFRNGQDPLVLLGALADLGQIVHLETLFDALPPAAQMDPESCYLGFEISLQANTSKAAIENIFSFAIDGGLLRIVPPDALAEAFLEHIQSLPEEPMRLGEILVRSGALTQKELEQGMRSQGVRTEERLGELLVDQGVLPEPLVAAAVEHQAKTQERLRHESRIVRVPADKLDRLINLVGELVISGASAHMIAAATRQTAVIESLQGMTRMVESIRDAALQLRMVPIGELFQRFQRVVRDTAHDMGKEIHFVQEGADTELDKSMVEKLADPVLHLIRNAIDHGIESADQRRAIGKLPVGELRLSAWHDSGSVWLEVNDDGRGLDVEKIRQKALAAGLLVEGQDYSEEQILQCIFEPGFSTAEVITTISGRGVGMDVVKRTIQSLRGELSIINRRGFGAAFRIRLPLTMAIIDGFLMRVGRHGLVAPLEAVVECLEWREADAVPGSDFIRLRGQALPCIHLGKLLGIEGGSHKRLNVVVIQHGGVRRGLLVDTLAGQCQTVVKPLGELFRPLKGIAGSTILGDGEVALILDLAGILELQAAREGSVASTH